jgi:hypothetical protein
VWISAAIGSATKPREADSPQARVWLIFPASRLGLNTGRDAQHALTQEPRFVGWLPEYKTSRRKYGGRVPCVRVFNRPAPSREGEHGGLMKSLTNLVWGLMLLVVAGCIVTQVILPSVDGQDAAARAFAQGVLNTIPRRPDWKSLTADKDTKDNWYTVTLDYATEPSPEEPNLDTNDIVRALLAARVAQGHHPSSEDTQIFVWAQRSGIKGETADDLVIPYGSSSYSSEHDSIEFKPYQPDNN